MRIWLIRHGKTPLNEEGRYQGKLDTGLSEEGRRALRRADASPVRVYVSPALRARQTAGILFPDADQVVVEDLREMDFGTFDGRGWWEMENDADYRAWVDGGCLGKCPGGEDRAVCSERVCAAFARILDGIMTGGAGAACGHPADSQPADRLTDDRACVHTGKKSESGENRAGCRTDDIFIVAHGGTQMAVLEKWGRPARDYYAWQTPCACGWCLEPDQGTENWEQGLCAVKQCSFMREGDL